MRKQSNGTIEQNKQQNLISFIEFAYYFSIAAAANLTIEEATESE